jgi:hypothetical protein
MGGVLAGVSKVEGGLMAAALVLAVIFVILRRQVIETKKRNANLVKFLKWKAQQMGDDNPPESPSS